MSADDNQNPIDADASDGADFAHEAKPPEMLITALQEQLAERDTHIADLRDRLTRQLAETENVRRRLEKEKQDANIYALRSFARDLLPVADNLRRALDAVPETARAQAELAGILGGVEVTERELLQVMGRFGITAVGAIGQKLDPNLHQAMAELESADQAPGTILQMFQPGYTIKGQLLRPAMVVVAKAPGDTAARVDTSA